MGAELNVSIRIDYLIRKIIRAFRLNEVEKKLLKLQARHEEA